MKTVSHDAEESAELYMAMAGNQSKDECVHKPGNLW